MIQKFDYDCAPVAIINAFNYYSSVGSYTDWLNRHATDKIIYKCLFEICETDEDGTYDIGTNRGLKWLLHNSETKVIRKRKIDFDEILNWIEIPGYTVLLNHVDYSGDPHVSFFYDYVCGSVYGENIFAGKQKDFITKRTFKKYVESSDGVWFIERR